jgi:putative OPT family oligopeptide transporter
MTEKFHPHIPSSREVKEFTFRAIFIGLAFSFLFAIANAYLALKIGTTVSASIPAAVISMGLFRFLRSGATILENNIVQTMATIGEAMAAALIFTVPALILLGESPSIGRIFLLGLIGGILGILMMIPMRRFIIVQEHKNLPFPEGTACASILKAGESVSKNAIMALWGALAGGVYKVCSSALFLWGEVGTWTLNIYQHATLPINTTPALLGVGYIVGPRISSTIFAGGILGWWVIIPIIKMFGLGDVSIYPAGVEIARLSSGEIWSNYIRYIGAGGLATGGLLSLFKIFPLLYKAIRIGVKELRGSFWKRAHLERTDRDISMAWVLIGSLVSILFLWLYPGFSMNFLTILLLVILSFFFVGVTCFTVGLVGSTSNPVSGMVITVLLITCTIFVLLGWTERIYLISAITMGVVSCSIICMAGTTSQDLKTGFLLGATPVKQQVAELIAMIIPPLVLGYTIYLLNEAYTIGSSAMPAPQATLLAMLVQGIIDGNLPFFLVGAGVTLSFIMALLKVPVLPFALGLYLPLSLTAAMMVGGLVRYYVNHHTSEEFAQERGLLLASGLIGGDACIGVVIALLTISGIIPVEAPSLWPSSVSFITFGLLAAGLGYMTLRKNALRSS